MNEQTDAERPWELCPQTPGIYRIVAKGKLQVPSERLSASKIIALAFDIDPVL